MATSNANVRKAIITILKADTTLKTLLGNVDGRIKRFQPVGQEQAPMLTYYLYDSAPGVMGRHNVFIQFDAWTTYADGQVRTADDILERVHTILTNQAMLAQGLDAWAYRTRGPMDMPTGMDTVIRQMAEYRIHVN